MVKSPLYYAAMKRRRKIPVIIGPTCIGKTDLSIDLSLALNGEVVSCDSRQVYIGMDIGTAKTPHHLQQIVRHHLIDVVYPDTRYNAQMWAEQAETVIDGILERGKIPLIVCGTGLYLAALTEGFFPLPEMNERKKAAIAKKLKAIEENSPLHDYLKRIDAESSETIHPNDVYRTKRALEIYLLTGKTASYHRKQAHKKSKKLYTVIGLTMERELLYLRIDQRVEAMVSCGFIDEVEYLLKAGYSKELAAFHAPGYTEFIKFLGRILTREAAIEETKIKTRNYAKRQFTWFKKLDDARWFDVTDGSKRSLDEIVPLIEREWKR